MVLLLNHDLKSWYLYLPMVFSINIGNIRHVGKIDPNIGQYYGVNIVSSISNLDNILSIFIRIGKYLKPCAEYNFTIEREGGVT